MAKVIIQSSIVHVEKVTLVKRRRKSSQGQSNIKAILWKAIGTKRAWQSTAKCAMEDLIGWIPPLSNENHDIIQGRSLRPLRYKPRRLAPMKSRGSIETVERDSRLRPGVHSFVIGDARNQVWDVGAIIGKIVIATFERRSNRIPIKWRRNQPSLILWTTSDDDEHKARRNIMIV